MPNSNIAPTYDWSPASPAWLGALQGHCSRLGIDPAVVVRELAKLFPADVCGELATTPEGQRLVAPLFSDGRAFFQIPALAAMVTLAHDLASCPGWERRTGLLAMLRSPRDHFHARFEVGIWSSLTRIGLHNRYEESDNKSKPSADHAFSDGGLSIRLETKTLDESMVNRNIALLYAAITIRDGLPGSTVPRGHWFGPGDGTPWPPHFLRVIPTTDLIERTAVMQPNDFLVVLQNVRSKVEAWYREHLGEIARPPFRGLIEGVGEMFVDPVPADHPGGLLRVELDYEDRGLDHEVTRILRLVKDAQAQLIERPADMRVAAVWVSPFRAPVEPAIQILQERLLRDPGRFLGVDYVVLINTFKYVGEEAKIRISVARHPGARHDCRQLRFLEGIARWRHTW